MLTGAEDEEKRPRASFFFIRGSRQHHPNSPHQILSYPLRSSFYDVLPYFSVVCHTIFITQITKFTLVLCLSETECSRHDVTGYIVGNFAVQIKGKALGEEKYILSQL